jgi:hypothetical protein
MPDETPAITCLASLEQALTELQGLPGKEAIWWRGNAHTEWKLQPGVFRVRPQGGSYDEHALISSFEKRAAGRLGHRVRPRNEIEWLLLAQHYGLPTRLLDWTESPLVALYFAVGEEHRCACGGGCDGYLWATLPTKLNEVHSSPDDPMEVQKGLVDSYNSPVQALALKAFGVKDSDILTRFPTLDPEKAGELKLPKVLALAAVEMDERIVAQTGRFTIHGRDDDIETHPDKDKYLRKFLIPAGRKGELRKRLDWMGVRRWNLFPDLQSLAEGLKRTDFMQQDDEAVIKA